MSKHGFDGERQFPFPKTRESQPKGQAYLEALQSRGQAILNSLMGYLASNYRSTIPSTEYSYYLRAMSIELARLTLELEELQQDISFETIRSERLVETLGTYLFGDTLQPNSAQSDEDFRCFLLAILDILFEGSKPSSVEKAVALLTDLPFELRENFKEARKDQSPFDISDQFGFSLEFDLSQGFPTDTFQLQQNLELLYRIIKPAHVLHTISYRFSETYIGPDEETGKAAESFSLEMADYRYEDSRGYCQGLKGWESTTGNIDPNDFTILVDEEVSSPFLSVSPGVTILIKEGSNSGRYRVLEVLSENEVRVTPRFREAQDPLTYEIEVDRLGKKVEVFVSEEDASSQMISPRALEVTFTVSNLTPTQGEVLNLQASSNFNGDMTYEWDFTGNNVFDDAIGDSVSYTTPATPGPRLIRLLATSGDGRIDRVDVEINIT